MINPRISVPGFALVFAAFLLSPTAARTASQDSTPLKPPASGPVALYPEESLRPGMKGIAWTVFQGSEREQVPVEILGIARNMWGPRQDIIIGKLAGKAAHTNVAGGMSGSPVFIDGKLVGAISLRLSVFSPDAICGITPIGLMLEVDDLDRSLPLMRKTPGNLDHAAAQQTFEWQGAGMTPIATPVTLSGFTEDAIAQFGPLLKQSGMEVASGGVGGSRQTGDPLADNKPAPDWKTALQPGESVAAVLVSGDMTITAAGTVTYNDGNRVLAFGHPLFNLGPVEMPLAKEEIITTLASAYTPTKMGNTLETVGALRQDRHSAIAGELGQAAAMIPVSLHVRSFGEGTSIRKEKDFRFSVFVDQKWTPYLMTATLFNAISNLNDYSDEATYRLHGALHVAGQPPIDLTTMQAPSGQIPTPMLLAGWWGDKFNRLFVNSTHLPKLDTVDIQVDLLPDRRIAQIESASLADRHVSAGSDIAVHVTLKPFRGERLEREVPVHIPAGTVPGEHQILFSDAETLSHIQNIASSLNRVEDIPQTVALLNSERSNNRMYVSLLEAEPTVYSDEKVLPSLPASVLHVMGSGRATNHQFVSAPESAHEQTSIPFDVVVTGNYTLKVHVD